ERIFATGYLILPALLVLPLGGPPLYPSLLDFKLALASSLTWTIVPEVLDSSVQPVSGKCEPMNTMSRRKRPRGKRAALMSSPRGRDGSRRGEFGSDESVRTGDRPPEFNRIRARMEVATLWISHDRTRAGHCARLLASVDSPIGVPGCS